METMWRLAFHVDMEVAAIDQLTEHANKDDDNNDKPIVLSFGKAGLDKAADDKRFPVVCFFNS
jgi:hypothetical protein